MVRQTTVPGTILLLWLLRNPSGGAYLQDPNYEDYQPRRDTIGIFSQVSRFGGPIQKDKLWFFASFNPEFKDHERVVNWDYAPTVAGPFPSVVGPTPFSSNQQTYYSNARIDAAVTQKIRVFGSWLYQFQSRAVSFCLSRTTSTDNPTPLPRVR